MLVNHMAAGRKSVSLRREFCKYGSTKGFDHHTNGSFGVEVGGSRNHHFACSGETRFHVEKEEGEICVSLFKPATVSLPPLYNLKKILHHSYTTAGETSIQ